MGEWTPSSPAVASLEADGPAPRFGTMRGMRDSARRRSAPQPAEILAPRRAPLGAYVHVPFCASICPFCPYNKVLHSVPLARRYFEALTLEVERILDAFDGRFTSLYVGGGTPTLCIEALRPLVARIPVAGETGIEVLPTHATPEILSQLIDVGFDSVSLGLQSFDAALLRHLGRPHDADDNLRALESAVGRFACVDADLILDVNAESERTFLEDLETCLRAGVDQVSSYPLMRFGFTPLGKARQNARAEHRALRAGERLARHYGYERRSVWTFHRAGRRAFTSITREFFLGMGAGAASYTGREFLVNHFSIDRYVDQVQRGRLPVAKRASLGELTSAAYYLFWQAYTGSIDLRRFARLFPRARFLRSLAHVAASTGHVRIQRDRLALTPRGYDRYHDLERWVTYHFIEPLWGELTQEHGAGHVPLPPPRMADALWRRLAGMETVAEA